MDLTQSGHNPSAATRPTVASRACTICSRAKTKCLWGDGKSKCDRCYRLNKDCKPVTAPRKPRSGVRSKHELLERKLDRLEALLQAAQVNSDGDSSSTSAEAAQSFPSPESLDTTTATSPTSGRANQFEAGDRSLDEAIRACDKTDFHHALHPTITQSNVPCLLTGTRSSITHSTATRCALEPSPEEAEVCLRRFRTEMLPKFPIVALSDTISAHELRETQPYLWLSIVSISGRSTRRQKALGTELRIVLARETLVEGKANIDLLVGLLIVLAWGQHHTFEKSVASSLMHVAHALVNNLFLTRPKGPDPNNTGPKMLSYTPRGCPRPYADDDRTMHERRTLLGFFLLSAKTAAYFQRSEPVAWTPYYQECLDILEQTKERPSDLLIVYLVRSQLISEKAVQAVTAENAAVIDGLTRMPPAYHYKQLESELAQLKRDLPLSLQSDTTLLLQINQVNLSMHETALSTLAPISHNQLSISRYDFLNICLHALQDSLDKFWALPTASITLFPFWSIMQFGHCVITLFRLSTFSSPDVNWDVEYVRSTCDLSKVLEQIAEKLGSVRVEAGYDVDAGDDQTMFSMVAHMFRGFKSWWDHKVAGEKAEMQQQEQQEQQQQQDLQGQVATAAVNNLSSSDMLPGEIELGDAWFNDFLLGGDLPFDPFGHLNGP